MVQKEAVRYEHEDLLKKTGQFYSKDLATVIKVREAPLRPKYTQSTYMNISASTMQTQFQASLRL